MKTIQHRHVFYLSGFDPRGASFYHRLFKEEALKQSKINGISSNISKRKTHSRLSQYWDIEAKDQTQNETTTVQTQYEFLRWDDIIRRHWSKTLLSIFIDFIYVSWVYITSGTLKRVVKTSLTPAITGLYPAVFIVLSGLIAVLFGWISFELLSFSIATELAGLAWVVGLAVFIGFIHLAKAIGDHINVFWLLRIYAFTSHWAAGDIPHLDQRIDDFAERVICILKTKKYDEVILVGHSVGSLLAVAIAARVEEKIDPKQHSPLHLITLGECIPLLSLLPKATAIRNALALLSCSYKTPKRLWIDYTSPADGACFPLVDAINVSLSAANYCNSPILRSTRFHKLFHPARYQRLKRNFYQMHFLYLMANDIQGAYDFFALTTGKKALITRFSS